MTTEQLLLAASIGFNLFLLGVMAYAAATLFTVATAQAFRQQQQSQPGDGDVANVFVHPVARAGDDDDDDSLD